MGVVYRATHLALGRTVALKLIAGEYADDADFRRRFETEAKTAASLDQPHVLPIYHAGEEDGQLFITMRYVEDTDLRALIANKGRIEPREAATIVDQVGQALDAAHSSGLVHRDIKPANILISSQAGKVHAYVTDFGLTKSTASGGGLTKTGMWVGTLDYVAPEQIQGQRIDGRADVYALAAVLYQALTGKVPYDKESDVAMLWAHINDPPPSVIEAVPDLPEEFDEVIRRGMAKDPEDRYLSTGDLGRAALAAADHQQLSRAERSVAMGAAAPEGADAVPARSEGAPDPTAAGATSASPTGAGGAPPTAVGKTAAGQPDAPTPPPPPSGAAKKRSRLPLLIGGGIAALVLIGIVLAVAGVFGGGGDEPAPVSDDGSNPAGEVVGDPIAVGKKPYAMDDGESGVLVANIDDGTVSIIDPATNEVSNVKVDGQPTWVTEGEGGIWVANYDGAITRIDPGTESISDPIDAGGQTAGIAAGEGFVWVTDPDGDVVDQVDPNSLKTVNTVKVGERPYVVETGNGTVYVSNEKSKSISYVLPDDKKAYGEAKIGVRVFGLEYYDPRMYVGTATADEEFEITPYDQTSFTPGTPVTLPPTSSGVDVDPDSNSIWVTVPVDNQVIRIDLETGEQIGDPITVGTSPQAVVASGGFVWVANGEDDTVTKIDPGGG